MRNNYGLRPGAWLPHSHCVGGRIQILAENMSCRKGLEEFWQGISWPRVGLPGNVCTSNKSNEECEEKIMNNVAKNGYDDECKS